MYKRTMDTDQIEKSTDVEEECPKDIVNFKDRVVLFSEIDAKIRELEAKILPIRKQIRDLKAKKKDLRGEVCVYMKKNNVEKCNLPKNKGTIRYTAVPRKPRPTKNLLRDGLNRFFCVGPGKDVEEFNKYTAVQKATIIYDYVFNLQLEHSDRLTFTRPKV